MAGTVAGHAAGGEGAMTKNAVRANRIRLPALALAAALVPAEALAHASDRGHVLLLPTGHYIAGGAAAVALSFLVLAFAPPGPLDRLARWRLPLGSLPAGLRLWGSALSFLFLCLLVAAGFLGSRDPLSNPLPLVVWAVFWVGLPLVQGLLGDVWRWINPWHAPWRVLAALSGRRVAARELPGRLGYWPAILQFFAFVWFELVHPAPDDPAVLATAVTVYFVANLAAMLVFGHEAWSRQGECLSAFLRMMARLGVVEGRDEGGEAARIDAIKARFPDLFAGLPVAVRPDDAPGASRPLLDEADEAALMGVRPQSNLDDFSNEPNFDLFGDSDKDHNKPS